MGNRSLKILLVEDNEGDALLFGFLLKRNGTPIDFQVVSDGEVALNFLTHQGPFAEAFTPDIVLLDINIPKKNGLEVLSEMWRHPELKKLTVIMLTGSANKEDVAKSYSLDATSS